PGPRAPALARARASAHGRAPAADPARVPDSHPAGRSARARPARAPRRHRRPAARRRAALTRLQPVLLDACWKSPDPDEALNQFERFLAAAGPRAGYVELLAARPELLAGLVRLCAGGDLLAQLLVAQPDLLSSLADRSVLEGRRTRADFRAALT